METSLLDESNHSVYEEPVGGAQCATLSARKRKIILSLLVIASFLGSCPYSLMAPFIPTKAKDKGLSSLQTGVLFGLYQLVFFVSSPILGNYLSRLGVRFVLLTSNFMSGLVTVFFGITIFLPSGLVFFVATCLLRAVEAVTAAGFMAATFTIAANIYPDNMSLAFGVIQIGMNTGLMIAPMIGGALNEAGGFWLPFLVSGGSILVFTVAFCLVMPSIQDIKQTRNRSALALLGSSQVWIAILCLFNSAVGAMFLGPTLALHLKQFNLSSSLTGLMFAVTPTSSAVWAPLWGYLADQKEMYAVLIVVGNLLAGFGVFFIGPSPLFSFLPLKVGIIAFGLAMLGVFNSCGFIPLKRYLLISALNLGFENNLDTFGLICGLCSSVFSLGATVGPILGVLTVEHAGFPQTTTVIACFFFVSTLASGVYFLVHFVKRRCNRETDQSLYELLPDGHSTEEQLHPTSEQLHPTSAGFSGEQVCSEDKASSSSTYKPLKLL